MEISFLIKSTRKTSRASYIAEALINYKKSEFSGTIVNMSLNGIFVKTSVKIDCYENVDITINCNKGENQTGSASVEGVVARIDSDGLGIQFGDMSIGSFKAIKEILKTHLNNPAVLEKELESLKKITF